MCVGIVLRAALAAMLCMLCMRVFAEVATYDFEGVVTDRIDRGTQPFPAGLAPGKRFTGVAIVDLTAPGGERLLDLHVNLADGEILEFDPANSTHAAQLLNSADLESPPPHYDLVAIYGWSKPLAGLPVGIFTALNWGGEPQTPSQFPADGEDLDLSSLVPRQRWVISWNTGTTSSASGTIATFNRRDPTADYVENFDDGAAQDWTPLSGQWAVESGYYRNSSNVQFTGSVHSVGALPDDFVMRTDVYLSWGATGNTAGVLFNRGPGNFFEVRVNARGAATLSQVIDGRRASVATGTYPGAGVERWVTIYVNKGLRTQVEISGKPVFNEPLFALSGGVAGVFSSWNMARFDNVMIGRPVSTADIEFLPFAVGGLGGFTPFSGTWTIANGALRSSSNQASAIALYEPFVMNEVYEIAASIHSDWSASGNQSGFVYDYLGAGNYKEARVSLGANRVGTLLLAEVVNGVRREVARKSIALSAANFRDIRVHLTRERGRVIFGTNVQDALYVQQPLPPQPKRVGVMTSWNLASFDDVVVYRVNTR